MTLGPTRAGASSASPFALSRHRSTRATRVIDSFARPAPSYARASPEARCADATPLFLGEIPPPPPLHRARAHRRACVVVATRVRRPRAFDENNSSTSLTRVRAPVDATRAPVVVIMRPLEEAELEQVLTKLFTFVGKNIENVLQRADAPHSLRLHKKRVYYVRDDVMKRATSVGRDQLVSLGTCVGKFTHSDKFRLTIGALDLLAAHAKYKMWVKPTSEMGFMYGNHLLKSGLGRISENTPANAGVVIYSMADVPIGFGVAAKSTQDCRKLDPSAIVAYHLADVGEYLRAEDTFVPGKKD